LESAEILALSSLEGKLLADHVAIGIGNLGENIILKRATCINTKDTGLNIMGFTHPSTTIGLNYFSGKYGSLIVYRKQQNNKNNEKYLENSDNEIIRQICQHIIGKYIKFNRLNISTINIINSLIKICFNLGMNPKGIGEHKSSEPIVPQKEPDVTFSENSDTLLHDLDEKKLEVIEKQNVLEQDFLLNPSMTVGQIVTDHDIVLLDFVRYECGDS